MQFCFKGSRVKDEFPIVIPLDDILSINKECGGEAVTLYYYYHSKGQRWKWKIENMCKDLGWSADKVRRIRSVLKDSGWIDYWKSKGNSYLYLGKDMVQQSGIDRIEEGVDSE